MRPGFVVPLLALCLAAPARADFPPGFLWGTAISGFQTEMGGDPSGNDTGSDWWVWAHDPDNIDDNKVSGDFPEAGGPRFWDDFRSQIRRQAKRGLANNALRVSIEWSRIFPTSTASVDASGGITQAVLEQLDALADQDALRHYRRVLFRIRGARMKPFVTVNHFTLPLWIHDPIAARDAFVGVPPADPPPTGFAGGWLDTTTAEEFAKYAAYLAWKLGRYVDYWAPINEPLSVASGGYANIPGVVGSNFPPGVLSYTGLLQVVLNMMEGQRVAYDAIKQWDLRDADRDGDPAVVGAVINLIHFEPNTPGNANDIIGAEHASYLYNRLFPNAIFLGDVDANANGTIDPGEHQPDLVGRSDFFGVNYYFRGKALKLGAPITPAIPLFDFLPVTEYATPERPFLAPCPTTCTEFGWEIYPPGLREVLAIAGSYGRPVYITENGLADADDDQRPAYLVQHLAVLEQAIADDVADVRGYFHWSLVDNFEWARGYFPKFGLYRVDGSGNLLPRGSAGHYRRIAEANAIPADLLDLYGP
jgi:beta-glucosidase/6-phospho-beta-glucosidase/beta-galactosidase